jgi:hypothetical protein
VGSGDFIDESCDLLKSVDSKFKINSFWNFSLIIAYGVEVIVVVPGNGITGRTDAGDSHLLVASHIEDTSLNKSH